MKKLNFGTKLGYGIGDLGGNLFFTIIGFYLLYFLTDVVKLSAGLAGTALMIGKFWDAITDPAVGYISDNTRTRLGRRRPYILAGAIALFFTMILMFTPLKIPNQISLFFWTTFTFCLLNTAYTIMNIPYSSLGADLTSDYHERTVLNAFRTTSAIVGTFLGAAVVLPIVGISPNKTIGWPIMGGIMGAVMMATALITFFTVRERAMPEKAPRINIIRSYISALSLRTYLTALFPWTFHIIGVTIIQGALLYYFKYIFMNESAFQIALIALLTSAVITVPFWVAVSKRIGKKATWNAGMLIFAIGVILFFLFTEDIGITFGLIMIVICGIGFSTQYVIPYALVPDIVEYDYAKNGVRREGVFYGLWTFMSKIGQALALVLSGWILDLFNYLPPSPEGIEAVQPESAVFGIKLLIGPIPVTFFIAGVIVLSFYPITKQFYQRILEMIAEREQDALS